MPQKESIVQKRTYEFFIRILVAQIVLTFPFCIYNYFISKVVFVALVCMILIYVLMLSVVKFSRKFTKLKLFYRVASLMLSSIIIIALSIFPAFPIYYVFTMILPLVYYKLLGIREGLAWSLSFLLPLVLVYTFRHIPAVQSGWSVDTVFVFCSVLMAYGIITYIAYQIEQTFILAYRELTEANGELERKNRELMKAKEEIRSLKETLPICSSCKRIRDDSGEFVDADVYLRKHTDTDVTHSLCPDCLRKLYPDIAESIENDNS